MKLPLVLAAVAALLTPLAAAQKMQTKTGEAPGPWLLGTIGVGKKADGAIQTTALKGLALKLGEKGQAGIAYDLDLCRVAGAWTGGKFVTPVNLMSRGEYPTAMGDVVLITREAPGISLAEEARGKDAADASRGAESLLPQPSPGASSGWKDPRPEPFGPLPPGHARFKGFYPHGAQTILKWEVAGIEVLELPQFFEKDGVRWFERILKVGPHPQPLRFLLGPGSDAEDASETRAPIAPGGKDRHPGGWSGLSVVPSSGGGIHYRVRGEISAFQYSTTFGQLGIVLPPSDRAEVFAVQFSPDLEKFPATSSIVTEAEWQRIQNSFAGPTGEPGDFTKGGPARWPETVITKGSVDSSPASSAPAYVVDTIKLPDPNPWSAPLFLAGLDFFEDGRAAVSTFHGDVFVVSGLDEKLEQVTWRRFASGLFHPLGLKIVKGEIHVTCRDGIWRLKDLNQDGEADFYEAFNFDLKVTKNFHEFVFDLQTDAAGNFYFSKAGPVKNGGRGFDQIMGHHGALFRLSPDGGKLEIVATGLRAPNGIGVGPRGELTSGDNEGTWMPACKINWIKPGGFYGVVDLAQRTPPPSDYDRPLCWLPKRIDNSSGGQVWVPEGERWGPWGGKMLHLSYGQSALYGVLAEPVAAFPPMKPGAASTDESVLLPSVTQGGVTKFPLQFQSGIMRGRFNPVDGQLYLCGLRGWQTNGLKNGALQRVRYTGAVPRMPIALRVRKGGIELQFACSLDTQSARDPENWNLEQWQYLWSGAYGSPELSTQAPEPASPPSESGMAITPTAKPAHDPVIVKSVAIGTDERTVFLEIPELKPVMQMSIKYDLKSADGAELRGEVVNTIHALAAE
ncbi:MAG TPA: DUF6797 domain-containing protein [Chthoniobacteraceae bacterium]|jgi:hypothetical protein